jgi:hypothetical protein
MKTGTRIFYEVAAIQTYPSFSRKMISQQQKALPEIPGTHQFLGIFSPRH